MSNRSIVDQIRHYQKDIERCPENSERMMRCIQRLYVMPILVQHLQETGIGRSVNSLKKSSGEVGDAAKALVNKWKKMVAEEESDDACNQVAEKTDDNKNPPTSESVEISSKTKLSANDKTKGDSKDVDPSRHSSKKRSHSENDGSKVEKMTRSSSKDRRSDEKDISSKDKRRDKTHRSESSHKHKDESSKKSSNREHSRSETNKSDEIDKKKSKESSKRDEHRHSRGSHSSKEQHRKERSRNGSDGGDSSPLPKKRKKTCVKERRKQRDLSSDRGSSSERDKSPGSDSDDDRRSADSVPDDGDSGRSSDESGSQDLDRQSVDGGAKEPKGFERRQISKSSSHSYSSSKPKPKESSKDQVKILENGKKIKQEKIDPAYQSFNSPSLKGSPSPGNSKSKVGKIKVEHVNDDGIDAGSGFSFADALAGLDPSSGKKKKKSIKPDLLVASPSSSSKSHSSKPEVKKEKPSTSSSSSRDRNVPSRSSMPSSSSVKREPSSGSPMPELLARKPLKMENLDLDINSTLPEINPNYRPLPHVPEHARRNSTTKVITNDEEMFSMMMNKNQRTKVFSGGKTGGRINKVPSLYELCIKLLYDNIDGLEFTGGVPFDLLKPLLEKLNPDQLFVLEHYNSYLIEDTGPMWEFHCKKDFRTATRQDMETWRELYVRCMEEREEKLKALTQNITKSIAQSVPVRKAQLAYVNSAVKPPRNVAKKQAKYGTGDSSGICPSLKSNSAEKREILNKAVVGASNGNVLATTTVPAPPPSSAPRATSSWSAPVAAQSLKKRKAPLMAKTLQLMKGNRFKR